MPRVLLSAADEQTDRRKYQHLMFFSLKAQSDTYDNCDEVLRKLLLYLGRDERLRSISRTSPTEDDEGWSIKHFVGKMIGLRWVCTTVVEEVPLLQHNHEGPLPFLHMAQDPCYPKKQIIGGSSLTDFKPLTYLARNKKSNLRSRVHVRCRIT